MKRFWNWFSSLTRSSQIGLSVCVLHVAVIGVLCINHFVAPRLAPHKPIAVRTQALPRAVIASPPAAAPTQKVGAKPAPAKKEVGKPAISKTAPNQNEALLKQLADSLEAVIAPTPQPRKSFEVALPATIVSASSPDKQGPSYGDALSAILQNSLDLPEFGEVTAKIDIDPNGIVVGVDILEARSRKNSEFLKKRLQELLFPCFNDFGLCEKHLTFTVTFRNVENR